MSRMRYVELDVHKDSIAVAVAETGRREVRYQGVLPPSAAALRQLVCTVGPPARLRFAYEAGPCGYGVQRLLTRLGCVCWSCPTHEDKMSRGPRVLVAVAVSSGDGEARQESLCVVASRPFGVGIAPACVAERLAPHGFLGSRPTGQHGVTGAVVEAQMGSPTHQAESRRPADLGVSRKRRVMVCVKGPSSTPRRVGWKSVPSRSRA